jgi:hypothetical protein
MVQKLALDKRQFIMDLFMASNGIRRAAISNKNLVDYKQWGLVAGEWSGITTFGSVCLLLMWKN